MQIDDLLRQDSEWLKGTGPYSNIVVSSRTRVARNLEGIPFSHWAQRKRLDELMQIVERAVQSSLFLKNSMFLHLKGMSEIDRLFLVERHLMSPEHAQNVDYKALVVDPKEIVSIMINEEDHLRIQVLQSGFNLREAWKITDEIDTELSRSLPFAYSSRWGYLTACPTNTGTGLRGSVMIHIPALVFTDQINKVLQAVAKLGLNVRGLYGEGTEASGNFFQVSNQVALGRSEEEILDNIEKILNQIVAREEATRRALVTKNRQALVDRVWRAYGTLKNARIITSNETIALLSVIRLGVEMGIIKNLTRKTINELFILTQPAHLQKLEKKVLGSGERDVQRADLIREKFK